MVPLSALWLPVVCSRPCWCSSPAPSSTWCWPIHKNDLKKVPDEDAFQDAFRRMGITPGDYAVPCAGSSHGDEGAGLRREDGEGTAGVHDRAGRRPHASWARASPCGSCTASSSACSAAMSAGRALAPGAQTTSTCFDSSAPSPLRATRCRCRRPPSGTNATGARRSASMIDGLVYGMLTAGTFGWLWPKSPSRPIGVVRFAVSTSPDAS